MQRAWSMLAMQRVLAVLPLLWCAPFLSGQAPTTAQPEPLRPAVADRLSPAAEYQKAMRPLEVTRASLSNWSDTEQAALGVAIKQAAEACALRHPGDFHGADLIGLARLCSLGLAWQPVVESATRYIDEAAEAKPLLADAHAMRIHGLLNLKDEPGALKSVLAMLDSQPYNTTVADASTEAIDYMKLLFTADALAIAGKRQSAILAALGRSQTADDTSAPHELYRQGLVRAELQQLAGDSTSAAETVTTLESALPAEVTGDERLRLEALRRRYRQIGQPLIGLAMIKSLRRPYTLPQIPAKGAVTALLLFPDWCAQCLGLARQIPESVFTVAGHEAYVYGLLAQTVPPRKLPTTQTAAAPSAFDPSLAAESLRETATVTVPPALLERFDASVVPLLIVADSQGVVRLIDVADEAALRPGNTVDSAIALVAERWAANGTVPAKKATPAVTP